ncbi:MAG: TetR/AcrR family transcriptional regulator [Myxococcota bacterium]
MTPETATATEAPRRHKRGQYAKTAATRARILAAARHVAQARGFHRVSLSEVARRAGVAVGNVSYHFGSRDELLRALMRSVADEIVEHVIRPAEGGGDYFERAEASLRAYLAFVHRHPAYLRMGDQLRHHRPEIHRRYLEAWLELQRSALQRGIDEGSLRPMSPDEIAATAHFLVGVSQSLDRMVEGIDGRSYPGDDVVVETCIHFLRGGLARSPRGAEHADPH